GSSVVPSPMSPTTAGSVVIVLITIVHIHEQENGAGRSQILQRGSSSGINILICIVSLVGFKLGGIGFLLSELEIPFPVYFLYNCQPGSICFGKRDELDVGIYQPDTRKHNLVFKK